MKYERIGWILSLVLLAAVIASLGRIGCDNVDAAEEPAFTQRHLVEQAISGTPGARAACDAIEAAVADDRLTPQGRLDFIQEALLGKTNEEKVRCLDRAIELMILGGIPEDDKLLDDVEAKKPVIVVGLGIED